MEGGTNEAAHLPKSSFLSRCRMTSWFSHAEQTKGGSGRGHPDTTSQIARKDYLSPAAAVPASLSSTVSTEGSSYIGVRGIMNSVRVSVSLSHRPEGSGNHSLLSSPSFPFITLTLWPRPRHAFRLCNYAFRHGAVLALPPRSHIVSLSLLSPISRSALNPPRDHQREKRTIGFGPNHHRAGDIKWTDQRQCHCTLSSSASPPDRHYYRNKGASAGQGKGSATWAGNVENWIE